jgi:methyl-accepting chemotaxis protein
MSAPHSPADLLRGLIARTFSTLSGDTRRAQGLLRDAMPRVVGSFVALQAQVRDHMKLITSLSTQFGAEATTGGPGLGAGMRVVIDTFVGDLISVSRQSMKIVEQVTIMGTDVQQMLVSVNHIEEMAGATRIIALNAEIESNRMAQGAPFRVVADETKRLAREAAHFSDEIRHAVDRCKTRLDSTKQLVGTLASHDMTVALRAQDNLAKTIETINAANAELLKTLAVMDEQVNAAMTALQFDDILTQLLGTIDRRITLLQDVWLDSLPAGNEELTHMLEAWKRRTAELEVDQVVKQESVATGTTELF